MFFDRYKDQFDEIKEAVEADDSEWDIIEDYEEVEDHTLLKLIIAILFQSVIVALILHLLIKPDIVYIRGFYIGVLLACFMVICMDFFNHMAVEGPQHLIKKRLWTGYIVRLVAVVAVMVLGLLSGYADVITMLIGIMEIKIAVYTKPVWDRLWSIFISVGVQSPTEINAPRGCARIRKGSLSACADRIRRASLAMRDLKKDKKR